MNVANVRSKFPTAGFLKLKFMSYVIHGVLNESQDYSASSLDCAIPVNAIARLDAVHIPHVSTHHTEQFSTCRLFYNNPRLSRSTLMAILIWLSMLHFIWNKILPLHHFHTFTALSYYKDKTNLLTVLLPPLSCLDSVIELRSDDARLADFPMCWLISSSAE